MLTQSQHKALDHSRHLSVTANAGSGKTLVLVERYIDILLSGTAVVNEVVAITFTEKAAGELRKKIADRISKLIGETPEGRERRKFEAIRENLASAMIGTIHSFCARILREHPVEAGIDAAFTVLEPVDQQMLLDEAIKETFEAVLKRKENDGLRRSLIEALRHLGKHKVINCVHALALKREQVYRWLGPDGLYTRSDEEVTAHWRNHLTEYVRNELGGTHFLTDLDAVIAAAGGKAASEVRTQFNAFKSARNIENKMQAYTLLAEGMFKKDGGLSKYFLRDIDEEPVLLQAKRLKDRHRTILPLLEYVQNPSLDESNKEVLKRTRCFLNLYQEAVERFEQKKRDRGELDFEDLQILAKELMTHENVRRRLAQKFKFIMVDEYQDTNRLQYEILLPIVDNLDEGNLFIVGDPKQSIYGFRNANVSVFNQTKEDIKSSCGAESEVVLNDSFRPLRDLVACVNLVFAPLMSVGGDDEVCYDPLVKARQAVANGRVEVLLRDGEGENSSAVSEGDMIARRILQLRSARHQVHDRSEQGKDLMFRDIAILLRTRRSLPGIEEALVRHGIPYLVSGGVGYFQTQDIYDFYNYFQFLLNPEDDVALVGILRSPFFNVSDAELFEVGGGPRSTTLWKFLVSPRSEVGRFPSLGRAIAMLREDLEAGSRLTAPELISWIVDRTGYAGIIAGTSRGEQSKANLEKFQRMARRYEGQGFTNLYDFVKRLKRLIEQEDQEGQGTVDAQGDAVQIMTVHAAKGLEFPVVVVPNLERSFLSDSEPYFDEHLGMGVSPYADEEDNKEVPITLFLKRKLRRKSVAEEKRVFYVACTRARDMLILSGVIPQNRGTATWMNWLLDALGEEIGAGTDEVDVSVRTDSLRIQDESFVPATEDHLLTVHIVRPGDLPSDISFTPPRDVAGEAPRVFMQPVLDQPRGEIFSASKIRTYRECPAKYYLRYVIGLPVERERHSGDADENETEVDLSADVRGEAVHHVMERIDAIGDNPEEIRREVRRFLGQESLALSSVEESTIDEVTSLVQGILASTFWQEVQRGTDTRTEFSITAAFGDDFITGMIDRLFRDQSGTWTVVDYKTDNVKEENLSRKIDLYKVQLQFYALLVHRFFDVSPVRTNILFSSLTERPISHSHSLDDLRQTEKQLLAVIDRIKRGDFHPQTNPCPGCPFLPYGCPSQAI